MGAKKKMVKCLVCGAIFEEGIEICPVCGVGTEHFAAYEEAETTFKKDTKEIFLILGNGAAGISAAAAIRERNATCSIVMVSDEPVAGYNRPMLTKSLMGEMTPAEMAVHDEAWYQEHRILNLLEKKAKTIDSKEQEVTFDDGIRLKYSKCIYALGSECFIPPIPGHDKAQVVAIRRLADTEKISKLLPDIQNVVVIGGGVLGLEVAWELKKSGCNVTVLELADQLMGRQLDAEAGEMLKQIILAQGIHIHLSVNIEKIEGETSVTGVRMGDQTVIPAELVVVSAGVRANTAVAKTAGAVVEKSVVVNEKMETGIPHLYACGDCAEYLGVNYGIWPQAVAMGKTAGANAAGDVVIYHNITAALTFNGMKTSLFAVGDNGKDPQKQYTVKTKKDEKAHTLETCYFTDGGLCGAILIGDTSKMAEITDAVSQHKAYSK